MTALSVIFSESSRQQQQPFDQRFQFRLLVRSVRSGLNFLTQGFPQHRFATVRV